jgi:hypothetical protein
VEEATRFVLTLSNALSQEDLSKFVRLCFDYPLTGQAKEKVRLVPMCCSRICTPANRRPKVQIPGITMIHLSSF